MAISEYNVVCTLSYFEHSVNKKPFMKAAVITVSLERTYTLLFIYGFKNFLPILAIHYNYFNQLRLKKPIEGYNPKFGFNTSILFYPGMTKWNWMNFNSLLS